MSTVKTDSVIGSFLPIPVIEHATDSEVYTATAGQTVFTTTKFDRSNAIRAIAKSSGGAFSEVTASWTGLNTVTISGTILGAGQIFYIFKVGTHASKIRVQDATGAWVDLSSFTVAKAGANTDITSLTGLTTALSVSQGGTGKTTEFRKGFIDGLQLVYTGRTSLTVTAGAAYVSGLGKIVELTADKAITGISVTANNQYHAYLYENAGVADVEVSTVVPVRYYGTSYHKTGDTSRRYLGTASSNASSQIVGFHHDMAHGRMMWTEGAPTGLPFLILSGFNVTTPTLMSVNGLTPKEVVLSHLTTINTTGSFGTCRADTLAAPNTGLNTWTQYVGVGGTTNLVIVDIEIYVSRAVATLGVFYGWINGSGSATTVYHKGYTFER